MSQPGPSPIPGHAGRRKDRSAGHPEREGRRMALGALFEADFGQRTAERVLERRLAEEGSDSRVASHARRLVTVVALHRDTIDARIEALAPAWPVVRLARMDRALLRSGVGELLHCPATPARVAISEWVALAREYSGEPARRLVNGVLGRVVDGGTGMAEQDNTARQP